MKICVVTDGALDTDSGLESDGAVPARISSYRGDDACLLIGGQLAVDGNREALGRRALGVRKIALTMSEIREAGLQMERNRIVDLVADALLVEMTLQAVAIGDADHELIEDVTTIRRLDRQR